MNLFFYMTGLMGIQTHFLNKCVYSFFFHFNIINYNITNGVMGQFRLICISFFKKILEVLHPSLPDIPDGGKLVKSYSGISVVKFADWISFEQSEMTLLSGKYSACWCVPDYQLPHCRIFKSSKNKKTNISI